MGAKLKVFRGDINSFVHRDILDMLGEPRHVRQSTVRIVATTKAAAIEYVRSLPERWVGQPYSLAEMRIASGYDVDAMAAAGVFAEPAVFVSPLNGRSGQVVRVDADGPKLIGRVLRSDGVYEFEPAGTVVVKVTPAARERLARHLQMQSVASLDECRRQVDEILAVLAGPTGGSN